MDNAKKTYFAAKRESRESMRNAQHPDTKFFNVEISNPFYQGQTNFTLKKDAALMD